MENTIQDSLHRLVAAALAEDVGQGDITSALTIPEDATASMHMVARQELVVCGMDVPAIVYQQLDASVQVENHVADGDAVKVGAVLVTISGSARVLLTGERTALNLMQRMSGVATLTRQYVDVVKGTKAIILDTRKTMPGMRELDKYAVRMGGGKNHRMRLDDMVLIKDNHLAIGNRESGLGIRELVADVRKKLSTLNPNPQPPIPIVVECDTLEQVREALDAKPDRILLDNMDNARLSEAVKLVGGKIPLEASGGVNLQTVRGIAETGVDYISVGALTHSAPAVDIGADMIIQS